MFAKNESIQIIVPVESPHRDVVPAANMTKPDIWNDVRQVQVLNSSGISSCFQDKYEKKGMSSLELSDEFELRQKICWEFKWEIQQAMRSSKQHPLSGTVMSSLLMNMKRDKSDIVRVVKAVGYCCMLWKYWMKEELDGLMQK